MPSLETLAQRILHSPQALSKLLIGGLLCFIPVLNLFALGYLGRVLTEAQESRSVPELPVWDRWGKLFVDGCVLFVIGLVYAGIPLFLGSLLTALLEEILGHFVGFFAYIPLCIAVAVAVPLAFAAAFQCLGKGSLHSLWDVHYVLQLIRNHWVVLVAPTCAFWGLQLLGLGVYGLAHFCGLILYGVFVFRIFQE